MSIQQSTWLVSSPCSTASIPTENGWKLVRGVYCVEQHIHSKQRGYPENYKRKIDLRNWLSAQCYGFSLQEEIFLNLIWSPCHTLEFQIVTIIQCAFRLYGQYIPASCLLDRDILCQVIQINCNQLYSVLFSCHSPVCPVWPHVAYRPPPCQ